MYPVSSDGLNKETKDAVYFFSTSFEMLNNFSAHRVTVWNMSFPTAEHAFQWKKFSFAHPEIAKQIFEAPSPHAVKEISDANKAVQPDTWGNEKISFMEEILTAKAEQNEDVREALKRSGKRMIVENSPVDGFWGAGPDGKGRNELGKVWMKIRENLK